MNISNENYLLKTHLYVFFTKFVVRSTINPSTAVENDNIL